MLMVLADYIINQYRTLLTSAQIESLNTTYRIKNRGRPGSSHSNDLNPRAALFPLQTNSKLLQI